MQGFVERNLRGGNHLAHPSVDVGIILKLIFEKRNGRRGVDRCGSG
jgi:hypothetical protein